jgi:membrane-bound ClpP family serine protease
VIFFTAEVDTPTLGFAAMMGVASPVAVGVYMPSKFPKLIAEVISTIMHIAIVVAPVILAKLYVAVKAILVEVEASIGFMQFHRILVSIGLGSP